MRRLRAAARKVAAQAGVHSVCVLLHRGVRWGYYAWAKRELQARHPCGAAFAEVLLRERELRP